MECQRNQLSESPFFVTIVMHCGTDEKFNDNVWTRVGFGVPLVSAFPRYLFQNFCVQSMT